MSEIALKFLLANAAAAIAVLLVIAVRKPARAAFGARLAYGLWLLVPLAAIGGLLPPRIVEIEIPAIEATSSPGSADVIATIASSPERLQSSQVSPPPAPAATTEATAPPFDPWALGFLVWLMGGLAMFAWQLRNQSRFMADARAGFAGPAVAGFLRPRIITPSDFEDRFDHDERQVILAHETIHLRRNDARINAFVALSRCACWFNPLVHIAAHLMRIDQELACDAAVIERHPKARATYAGALLKAQLAARPLPLGCYWPAGTEHPLTERVEMLKQVAPGCARRAAGAAALAVLATAAGATAWAAMPPRQHIVFEAAPTTQSDELSDSSPTAQKLTPVPPPATQTPDLPTAPETLDAPPYATRAPQPARYEPQQSPPQAASPELPPPPMRPVAYPVPENFVVTSAPPAFDAGSPVYLRGKIEKIEFSDTTYVAFLRASNVARPNLSTDGPPRPIAMYANTDLWELSPTNYFGDRDSIRADLMSKTIEVSGVNLTKDCNPSCRVKVNDLIMPRSSEVPQPRADESLINQFGYWYDTSAPQMVRGMVERIEFSDRTFDAYIRSEARGALPSRLYQARSEYRFPRADIERALLGKTVTVSGWRARDAINTFCDPVCGLYANSFTFPDRSRLTPTGAALVGPSPYLQRPRGPLFMSIADLSAPVAVSGKVIRYVSDAAGENPVLWIESTGVTPASTFGSAPGATWVVAGFPFDASDEWVGQTVTIGGFNVEDKRCQPQCMMAGDIVLWRE